jgi:hypothetical protein
MESPKWVRKVCSGLKLRSPWRSRSRSRSRSRQRPQLYSPLPPNSIRLVTIQPGLLHEDIFLSVDVFDLDNCQPFDALSYVWGDPEPSSRIIGNGIEIRVTQNLFLALRRLRAEAKSSVVKLWIDAICINQEDNLERSVQVMLMQRIYLQAVTVIIWLGDFHIEKEICVEAAKQFTSMATVLKNGSGVNTPRLQEITHVLRAPETAVSHHFRHWLKQATSWHLIQTVVSSKWFTRVWVLQEFALARDITIMLGEHSFRSFDMFICALYIRKIHFHLTTTENMYLDRVVRIYLTRFPDSLLPQLETARIFHATDARDKVYAVLSLPAGEVNDSHIRSLLRPDYSKAVWEVYANVVRQFTSQPRVHPRRLEDDVTHQIEGHMRGEGVLDILRPTEHVGLLHDKDKEVGQDGFPSWVPRWDLSGSEYRHPPGLWTVDPKHLWKPSLDFEVGYVEPNDLQQYRVLRLKGIKLTNIATIFDNYLLDMTAQERNSASTVRRLQDTVKALFSTSSARNKISYNGPNSIEADFAETIVAGTKTDLSPQGSTDSVATITQASFDELNAMNSWLGRSAGLPSPSDTISSPEIELRSWLRWDEVNSSSSSTSSGTSTHHVFQRSVDLNRTLFVTRDGHLGIGTPKTRVGDEVWVLFGGRTLYVVRESKASKTVAKCKRNRDVEFRELVGECFVKGFMDSEAMNEVTIGRRKVVECRLV